MSVVSVVANQLPGELVAAQGGAEGEDVIGVRIGPPIDVSSAPRRDSSPPDTRVIPASWQLKCHLVVLR